jgi:hypothetical protein
LICVADEFLIIFLKVVYLFHSVTTVGDRFMTAACAKVTTLISEPSKAKKAKFDLIAFFNTDPLKVCSYFMKPCFNLFKLYHQRQLAS